MLMWFFRLENFSFLNLDLIKSCGQYYLHNMIQFVCFVFLSRVFWAVRNEFVWPFFNLSISYGYTSNVSLTILECLGF